MTNAERFDRNVRDRMAAAVAWQERWQAFLASLPAKRAAAADPKAAKRRAARRAAYAVKKAA